jgi:transcriptional regulator with XRE-family HTH domain
MMLQLRQAIRDDGRSLNKLAEAAGLDAGRLSRFLRAERDITFEAGCQLAEALGIRFTLPTRPVGGGPKPTDGTNPPARPVGRPLRRPRRAGKRSMAG